MTQASAIPFLGQEDFLGAAQALLPSGDAWPRDMDAGLTALLDASAASFARVHEKAALLSEQEAVPWLSVELLPAWEAAYGLPDPCTPLNATIAQRQAAVLAQVQSNGGDWAAYFTGVAAALGYTITITLFPPAIYGRCTYGATYYASNPWRFTWQVNVLNQSAFPAIYDTATYGEPYVAYSGSQLTCVLNRIKPAYSVLIMNYEVD